MTTLKPISAIIDSLKLTLAYKRVPRNPVMPESENMDHWKVTIITKDSNKMTLFYSKGYGHNGQAPTVEEVLDCLASDAAGYDNARSFEDWAGEYGYDVDSRKAERVYNTIKEQADKLKALLGPSAYAALLWETERF